MKRRLACAGVAGILASLLIPVSGASAYNPTCGNRGNFFEGFFWDPNTHTQDYEGARAYITNRYGPVCDTDQTGPNPNNNTIGNNFTTVWVMIADADYTSWLQAGVIRGYNTPQYVWAEHVRDETGYAYQRQDRFTNNPSIADGTRSLFAVRWNAACACEQARVDGTNIYETTYNPFGPWDNGPNSHWSPQYSGEKTYQASDIMGVPSAHVKFDNLQPQRFVDDTYVDQPCGLTVSATANRASHTLSADCSTLDIWTSS